MNNRTAYSLTSIVALVATAACLIGAGDRTEPTDADLAQVVNDALFDGAVDSWSGPHAGVGAEKAFEAYLADHDYQDIRKSRCHPDGDGGFTCDIRFVRVASGQRTPGLMTRRIVNDGHGWTDRQRAG